MVAHGRALVRMPRIRRPCGRRASRGAAMLLAPLALLGIATPREEARAQLIEPIVDCVGESNVPGFLRYEFGYSNSTASALTVPIGPDNFFTPSPPFRSQPTVFEPMRHRRVFSVLAGPTTTLRWNLNGLTAMTQPETPPCDRLTLSWRGPWEGSSVYLPGDAVSWQGSAWAASEAIEAGEVPGEHDGWDVLTERGEQGPPGPPGPEGQPGEARSFAGPRVLRFNRRGRAVVRNQRVRPRSVVVVQYAEPFRRAGLRPTNVVRVRSGRFVVRGTPRARFRFVIHKPGG